MGTRSGDRDTKVTFTGTESVVSVSGTLNGCEVQDISEMC